MHLSFLRPAWLSGLPWWFVVVLLLTALSVLVTLAAWLRSRGDTRQCSGQRMDAGSDPPCAPRARRGRAFAVLPLALIALWIAAAAAVLNHGASQLAPGRAVHLEVTAHQWWWSVRYAGVDGRAGFTTANEIHIPVGRPVFIRLSSADAPHGFALPGLSGHRDLVPGRPAEVALQTGRPGIYPGRCDAVCGSDHAFMGFEVQAQPEAEYETWVAHQAAAAPSPPDGAARQGAALFESAQCAACHAIRGTTAHGGSGPDLTHFASRRRIAAGTRPNTVADLRAWLRDPQKYKPGTEMPATAMGDAELAALVAYLRALE